MLSDLILQWLDRYEKKSKLQSTRDYENALKEIIQEIILLSLWRSKFFEKALFYGGSTLRILHGLNRFSEDLDFSLLKPDPVFSLVSYQQAIVQELESFGFEIEYDLIWYARQNTPLNLKHLSARMQQTGHLESKLLLGPDQFKKLLADKTSQTDFHLARQDVSPFIQDKPEKEGLDLWSEDFFNEIASRIIFE